MSESDVYFEPEALSDFIRNIFARLGSSDAETEAIAASLVETSLMGHDSHGVSILPRYVERALDGRIVANQHITVVKNEGPVLVIDGNRGYGQVIGREALTLAIEKAKADRFVLMGIRNTHHLGRIGEWAEMCAEAGFISMHFSNGVNRPPIVAPFGGALARMGTAPYTAAFPRKNAPPVLIDMASSVVSMNKVRIAKNRGVPVAEGTVIDSEGNPTTDPGVLYREPTGALLPVGGHKGYALGVAVELFAGALTGGGVMIPERDGAGDGATINGLFSVIFDPELMVDRAYYEAEIEAYYEYLKSTPPAPGVEAVLVPGDPEQISLKARTQSGVPIDGTSWVEMCQAARDAGLNDTDIPAAISG